MSSNQVICTNCELRTTDGCGPGPVMMCGHSYFKDTIGYEAAIIRWTDIDGEREAVSDECPKANKQINPTTKGCGG